MADEDLRALERRWAEGAGDLASGDAFFRALERAGADTGRLLEVRLQVLRGHMVAAGLGDRPLSPLPEIDPFAATFSIPVDDAIAGWHRLRARVDSSSAYPVIVGPEVGFELLLESIAERIGLQPDATLALAPGVTLSPPGPAEWRWENWPAPTTPSYHVLSPETSGGTDLHLVLLPTRVPWHAAAYFRFDASDVAWHRRWCERHGAEPVVVDPDYIEFRVSHPPRTREDAMRLAAELFSLYHSLELPHEDVETFAAHVLESTIWTLLR